MHACMTVYASCEYVCVWSCLYPVWCMYMNVNVNGCINDCVATVAYLTLTKIGAIKLLFPGGIW